MKKYIALIFLSLIIVAKNNLHALDTITSSWLRSFTSLLSSPITNAQQQGLIYVAQYLYYQIQVMDANQHISGPNFLEAVQTGENAFDAGGRAANNARVWQAAYDAIGFATHESLNHLQKLRDYYAALYVALYPTLVKYKLTDSGSAGTAGPCLPVPMNGSMPKLYPVPSCKIEGDSR